MDRAIFILQNEKIENQAEIIMTTNNPQFSTKILDYIRSMNMKKIGLITFHASHNNGSMLQALALQTILIQHYGCKTEIIDFSNPGQRNMYAPLPKADNWKRVIKNLIWLTQYKQILKQYNAYNCFSQKYFILTKKKYKYSNELRELDGKFDAVIAGSDQVWNIACRDADDAYYLNFLEKTSKYGYAVSFGANNPFTLDGKNEIHKKLVEQFSQISVRENNAKKWIRETLGKEVPICLDPTMLLNAEQWENLVDIGTSPIIKGDYIYYYCFSITEDVQRFLKWLSKKNNMPVYFMEAKEWTLKMCWRNRIKLIRSYGPDVYMNVVKYSNIFITTSFHGTAFATIFKKNFWYISDGKVNKNDDRAQSFLTQLGLMGRYKTIKELMATDISRSPDYTDPYIKLAELQKFSYAYLNGIINEIKEL